MNNKNSRIEIRLPMSVKEKFQRLAQFNHTTMSNILLKYILKLIEEEPTDGI